MVATVVMTALMTTLGPVDGLANGLVLLVGTVGWMRGVIGTEPDPRQVGLLVVFHLVYGAVLGAVVGVV